jgi:hypothetical protein
MLTSRILVRAQSKIASSEGNQQPNQDKTLKNLPKMIMIWKYKVEIHVQEDLKDNVKSLKKQMRTQK